MSGIDKHRIANKDYDDHDISIYGDMGTGGAPSLPYSTIKMANTAAYLVDVMSDRTDNIGDAKPAFTLKLGEHVQVVGKSASNAHGVSYTPVTVPSWPGEMYWVRATAVDTPAAALASVTAIAPAGSISPMAFFTQNVSGINRPMWQVLLGVGSLVALGVGVYMLTGSSPKHSLRHA